MPILAELLEPVPGESPAGVSLRYEPIYDQIKLARTEEADVPQGAWKRERKTADWPLVLKLTTDALGRRSKDLQLAAWYTEARLRREGIAGLAEGLRLLRELLARFWDGLYPEIEDGDLEYRAAPIEWVGNYLDAAVRTTPLTSDGYDLVAYRESRAVPTEADASGDLAKGELRRKSLAEGKLGPEVFEAAFNATPKAWYRGLLADLDAARAALAELQGVADERLGEASPNLLKLRTALDEVRSIVSQLLARKLEADPDPAPAAVAEASPRPAGDAAEPASANGGPIAANGASPGAEPAAPAAARAPATASPAGPLAPTPRDRGDAIGRVVGAVRFLRVEGPGDPAPYLILRALRWGELRASRPLDPRLLVAPPTDVRSHLKELALDGRFADLLEAGEEVMAQPYGRGWLDLQRYSVSACEALGGAYDVVASAVTGALRGLLRDLPELPDLALMDDSPAANAETRAWLRAQGLAGAAAEEEAPVAEDRSAGRRDALARAQALLRAGDTQRAIQLLLAEADQEKSARARFLRRSQAAQLMVDSGFEGVALPILQEMGTLIERHGLDQWEAGETVAQPLGLLYRCLNRLQPGTSEREALYLRICRLDPLQAMQLASSAAPNGPGA